MAEVSSEQAKELILEKERQAGIIHPDSNNPAYKSLGRVEHKIIEDNKNVPDIGWKELPVKLLPTVGKYYPDNTKIQIRAALVKEIRHFSTIETEDTLDIDDQLNFILDNCCKIFMNGQLSNFKDILEIDRLYIILAIRDLSFIEGENKLQMSINCPTCGNNEIIEITKERLKYFNLNEIFDKYFNKEEKCFDIVTKSGERWKMYLPTLGVNNFIKNNIKAKAQQNKYIDRFYLKFSWFLFNDWRTLNEKSYKKMEEETFGWSHEKISLIDALAKLIQDSISIDIEHTCSKCGGEVKEPLSFQGGVKSLFLYSDPLSNLA